MKSPVLRRFVHKGSALAAGLFIDAEAVGEEAAERRLLRFASRGAVIYRIGELLVIRFAAPARMLAEESPGGLLVQYGECLSSAPLEKDELARLDVAGPTVLLARGGAVELSPLDGVKPEDPASWMDVSDFEVAGGIESLGRLAPEPRPLAVALDIDVRSALGAPPRPPNEGEILAALRQGASANRTTASKGIVSGAGESRWASALGRFLAGIAQVLGRLLGQSRAGKGAAGAGGGSASGAGQSLAVSENDAPPGADWMSSLARGLRTLSLRFLLWSRLAQLVGRRQAEYLSRMLEMFDRGDLDSALRHAIALGAEGDDGEPIDPALGTPSPRTDLAIAPRRRRGGPAMMTGPLLHAELRRRYRRAFEQLAASGQIEKAAFVLAELLGAHEEAVSFLEKHGRYRLAAEIAEARGLPPGLVVRQWWLADRARAVRLARSRGVFADAIHRLEVSGKGEEAAVLRLIWAETLAASGSFAAAVDAVWPVENARSLAAAWLDRAIELGGPAGTRMAVRKARLFPGRFAEARDRLAVFLREPGEEGLTNARAAGTEIVAGVNSAAERVLSRPVVRALLRSEEAEDADLAKRVLAASLDDVLRADVEPLFKKPAAPLRQGASVSAAAVTDVGPHRHHNEDACLAVLLSGRGKVDTAELAVGDTVADGVVIGAFDGVGGNASGDTASQLARDVIAERLRRAFSGWNGAEAEWGEALREAVEAAGEAIYRAAMADPKMRGCGSTVAVASAIGSSLFVAHAGDSRAYLYRNGEVTQLTRDHSLLNEYAAMKQLTAEELADFPHKNVITRALGMTEKIEVDVAVAPLSGGDVALVCTDGAWEALKAEDLKEVLSSGEPPEKMCRALMMKCLAAGTHDNVGIAIARFEGLAAGRRVALSAVPRQKRRSDTAEIIKTTNGHLSQSREPVLIRRAAADTGAIGILDAAELPDGRVLVALGELGARLVSREGKTLARFSEPAHRIVISDHGDRALLVATRGEAMRVARVDLVGRRQEAWCDVVLAAFAPDFDGSVWYVALGDALYAIDATSTGWEHLWHIELKFGNIVEVARDERHVSARFVDLSPIIQTEEGATAPRFGIHEQIWLWELPSHVLRANHPIQPKDAAHRAALSPAGRLATNDQGAVRVFERGMWRQTMTPHQGNPRLLLTDEWLVVARPVEDSHLVELYDVPSLTPRARVELSGAARADARIGREHLLVFDDRGRLLVISLRSGAVLREMRLS